MKSIDKKIRFVKAFNEPTTTLKCSVCAIKPRMKRPPYCVSCYHKTHKKEDLNLDYLVRRIVDATKYSKRKGYAGLIDGDKFIDYIKTHSKNWGNILSPQEKEEVG